MQPRNQALLTLCLVLAAGIASEARAGITGTTTLVTYQGDQPAAPDILSYTSSPSDYPQKPTVAGFCNTAYPELEPACDNEVEHDHDVGSRAACSYPRDSYTYGGLAGGCSNTVSASADNGQGLNHAIGCGASAAANENYEDAFDCVDDFIDWAQQDFRAESSSYLVLPEMPNLPDEVFLTFDATAGDGIGVVSFGVVSSPNPGAFRVLEDTNSIEGTIVDHGFVRLRIVIADLLPGRHQFLFFAEERDETCWQCGSVVQRFEIIVPDSVCWQWGKFGSHDALSGAGACTPCSSREVRYGNRCVDRNLDPTVQFIQATARPTRVCGRGPSGVFCSDVEMNRAQTDSFVDERYRDYSFSDLEWGAAAANWESVRYPDVDGDGTPDVCGRSPAGIMCATFDGDTFGTAALWTSNFSDAQGWAANPAYWDTIDYPDVDGDGDADVCGRSSSGIVCALSNGINNGVRGGTGFSRFSRWTSEFSNAQGWAANAKNWATIQFPDVDGDGAADVCGRGAGGIFCAKSRFLASGVREFGPVELWTTAFSDAAGWTANPSYWQTIQFPRLNRDRKADVCGRSAAGIVCALSTGAGFGPLTHWSLDYSNAQGWSASPSYWATIQFADVNHDGLPDVCGRGAGGVFCSMSTGTTFGPAQFWTARYSDADGWSSSPAYWSTLQFPDMNGDGFADICGRGNRGVYCALSTGGAFGWSFRTGGSAFSGAEWMQPEHHGSLSIPGQSTRPTIYHRVVASTWTPGRFE